MKYVAYDYEGPATPPHWHIYSLDKDYDVLDGGTVLTITGPDTDEMKHAVERICQAIDDAVGIAERNPK